MKTQLIVTGQCSGCDVFTREGESLEQIIKELREETKDAYTVETAILHAQLDSITIYTMQKPGPITLL